jgi:hypothetical protein
LQAAPQTGHAAISRRENFVSDEVHPDQLRRFIFVEVTTDSVADAVAQLVYRCCLRENALADRTGNQAALWGVFDDKNDFAHASILAQLANDVVVGRIVGLA